MRATWLADVLRAEGLDVWESPGWRDRGKELASIHGVVAHHTASSARTSDSAVHALLRDGRRDLAGPLSQLGLERDGTWVVICDGRANHNGYGDWGNNSIGVEAYNDGVGERWPQVQLDAYKRGVAAILRHLKLTEQQVRGHKETDPRRKIDPAGIDMGAFRRDVAGLIAGKPTAPINPPPSDQSEEDDMTPDYIYICNGEGIFWVTDTGKASIDLQQLVDIRKQYPRPGTLIEATITPGQLKTAVPA